MESDGTAISASDGPPTSRPPSLGEAVTAPAVTDVEKDIIDSGGNSTSESYGESATASRPSPRPTPGELTARAVGATDSTPSMACDGLCAISQSRHSVLSEGVLTVHGMNNMDGWSIQLLRTQPSAFLAGTSSRRLEDFVPSLL